MHAIFLTILSIILWVGSCNPPTGKAQAEKKTSIDFPLQLPEGFEIDIYADGVEDARAMVLGDEGTLFVGSRGAGKVYAIQDVDQNGTGETVKVIDEDLNLPVGVTFKYGDLYVSNLNSVLRFDNIESNLDSPPKPVVVNDDFPDKRHHGWKFIDFGPDDKLYVPVGAPCNICDEDSTQFSNIMRMNADGSDLEPYAFGIRNTVGFAWHPETKELWFTDNGADGMGDDIPPCELNHAPHPDMHFGYPYCHGKDIPINKYGKRDCSQYKAPKVEFVAHTAPLGMMFYTGSMFPADYTNNIFVAQHGSWNRSTKSGYKVIRVELDESGREVAKVSEFISGFEVNEEVFGRPVDVLQLPDGSLLMSDDFGGKIYRITYSK